MDTTEKADLRGKVTCSSAHTGTDLLTQIKDAGYDSENMAAWRHGTHLLISEANVYTGLTSVCVTGVAVGVAELGGING